LGREGKRDGERVRSSPGFAVDVVLDAASLSTERVKGIGAGCAKSTSQSMGSSFGAVGNEVVFGLIVVGEVETPPRLDKVKACFTRFSRIMTRSFNE